MKKMIILILAAVMLCGLCACGGGGTDEAVSGGSAPAGAPDIVCTVFPLYDWVRNIMGDGFKDADVTLLLDSGTDLHSFQPTADDMITVSRSDLFIYVGGESDAWVPDVLSSSGAQCRPLSLMDSLKANVLEEETVEGMQAEEEEEEEDGPAYDEHIWLSLRNASAACDAICAALSEVYPDNASVYRANTDAYKAKLDALDAEFTEFSGSLPAGKVALFADRFPFRYFTEDYGIDYYAAFVGCSAETEASFETVSFLAGKIDEYGLKYVFDIEGSTNGLAQTVINNSAGKNAAVLTLDSMQSVTSSDVAAGADYLEIMRANCDKFREALGS